MADPQPSRKVKANRLHGPSQPRNPTSARAADTAAMKICAISITSRRSKLSATAPAAIARIMIGSVVEACKVYIQHLGKPTDAPGWGDKREELLIDLLQKMGASLDYEMLGYREGRLVKLDMLINGDPIDAFSVIIHRDKSYEWGRKIADKLKAHTLDSAIGLGEYALRFGIGTVRGEHDFGL